MGNMEILKQNRNLLISELQRVFKYEAIELPELMKGLVKYVAEFNIVLTGDIKQLKRAVEGLHTEFLMDNSYMVNSGNNSIALSEKEEELRMINKKQNNLYN